MLPRMLLHRPPRGGLIPRHKLVHRFEMFSRGEWWDLIRDEQAAVGHRRRRRRPGDDLESRAALHFSRLNELEHCTHAYFRV